jgi:leucyl-tRNA---protein transferase
MLIHQQPQIGPPETCPYLSDRQARTAYFFASDVSIDELDKLLAAGWRKFGLYFFRPACENCSSCIPLRVCVNSFVPSKSQRRLLNKNQDIRVTFETQWEITEEIFEIFEDHSLSRFQKKADFTEFIQNFGIQSCETLLSKYFIDGRLSAVGFIDCSTHALSSVYFIYRSEFLNRGLGNFSILKEIDYARNSGLSFYYLGFVVDNNSHMAYKGRFFPHQRMDWKTGDWLTNGKLNAKQIESQNVI